MGNAGEKLISLQLAVNPPFPPRTPQIEIVTSKRKSAKSRREKIITQNYFFKIKITGQHSGAFDSTPPKNGVSQMGCTTFFDGVPKVYQKRKGVQKVYQN